MGKVKKADGGKPKAEELAVVFTCEHGGNKIPAAYKALFASHEDVLESHRGWDPGALVLARQLAEACQAPLHFLTVSRLLVEVNRSRHHRALFSPFTRGLPKPEKQAILAAHYLPHRQQVEAHIAHLIDQGQRVLHIGVHSFTPVLGEEVRNADIGLLYDPSRSGERTFCHAWRAQLQSSFRVRLNYPYLGTSDGFTTYLRTQFADANYAGIELEVNQRFPLGPQAAWGKVRRELVSAFMAALGR